MSERPFFVFVVSFKTTVFNYLGSKRNDNNTFFAVNTSNRCLSRKLITGAKCSEIQFKSLSC